MRNAIKRVYTETWDTSSGALKQEVALSIRTDLLQGAFIKNIGGAKHLAVLLVIMAHSNAEGKSFPSQQRIGTILGMGRDTVRKIINDLLEVEIEGKYLISRDVDKNGKFNNNVYEILAEPVVKERREFNSGMDILNFYRDVYKEVYEVDYQPNYGRDTATFRDKLLKVYSDEQIRAIIRVGVHRYSQWATPQYPRPSVSMICGWVGNKALAIWQEESKEEQQLQDRMGVDMSAEAEALLALLGGE